MKGLHRHSFSRRWNDISQEEFKSLSVSRFLTASLVSNIIDRAYEGDELCYYPLSRLVNGSSPNVCTRIRLWIGYRFFSENAYHWARKASSLAQIVVCFYFADTKHQFDTTIPENASVIPITQFDACNLAGESQGSHTHILRQMGKPPPSPTHRVCWSQSCMGNQHPRTPPFLRLMFMKLWLSSSCNVALKTCCVIDSPLLL